MNIAAIDCETYFDRNFNLKRLSIVEYVHDPRFHVHGMAVRWPDGRSVFYSEVEEAIGDLQTAFGDELERTIVCCHHAQFDLYVLARLYGLHPRHFIDTMLLSHHVDGRPEKGSGESAALKALAERYRLDAKGELDFMCGVRHPEVRQLADLAEYAERDVAITAQLAELLLARISRPEVELRILMHTVRLFTQREICIDVDAIPQFERELKNAVDESMRAANVTPDAVSSDKVFRQLLESALARTGRVLPLKKGKKGTIPATAKNDPEMQALVNDEDPVVSALANARLEKKGRDQKFARLDTLRRIAAATGGKLPPYLLYYGGHTGRFAGGDGLNLQNLPRRGVGARIRNLLKAGPEKEFIIADLAQIEARVTAWLAGQQDMLHDFREGRDLYSEFASQTFGRPVRKPREDDPPDVRDTLASLRQVGKQAVLGLGFGMGARRFMETLRADNEAAQLFSSGDLSPIRCREIVCSFRETYSNIPAFWRELEDGVRRAFTGATAEVGDLCIQVSEGVGLVWLPSGRALRYPHLRLDPTPRTVRFLDGDGLESEFEPDGPSIVYGAGSVLYGGKLCENVVQALARDILVEGILRLEACGLQVLFHVHDEVIVEVEREKAGKAKEAVELEIGRAPIWAQGLPIKCEVVAAECYTK